MLAVADTEVRKLRHDPIELLTRALQPAIWLLLFGQVMAQVRGLGPQHGRYIDFLAPGILAQSVLFSAIFYGIAAIWERDLGVLHRYMVSPAPRTALVLGKALSSGVRGLSQAVIVYILAAALGIGISYSPVDILGAAAMIVVGSALFSTFSLIIACIVKTRDRFMGIGQVLTMPIFFASNAIYPHRHHAGLAEGDLFGQSAHLRSRRAAGADAQGVDERIRPVRPTSPFSPRSPASSRSSRRACIRA